MKEQRQTDADDVVFLEGGGLSGSRRTRDHCAPENQFFFRDPSFCTVHLSPAPRTPSGAQHLLETSADDSAANADSVVFESLRRKAGIIS